MAENLPLQISTIKLDVAIGTFNNMVNMAVSEVHLNKTDIEKVG